ncbi:MAG: response regulator transcription factor [Alloprevotella sp.]|nr:response regulator transcription factor [Alloprevotella sp.]
MDNQTNTEKRLSLVVLDDHPLVLEGLRSLLEGNPYLRSTTYVRSGKELMSMLLLQRYDVYMVDIDVSDTDGLTLISKIRAAYPDARIIVNTLHEEQWMAHRLKDLDVDAVTLRTSDPANILNAIEAVAKGQKYYCPEFHRHETRRQPRAETPSPREMEVLKAMAHGYSTVEISHILFISENTVETHRKNLMLKFGARNATDLVLRAIERGHLTLPLTDEM